MKTPKFRAWSKIKNKMMNVWYVAFVGDVIQIVSDGDNFYLYDESELMQFTGLCDINGTEIFEDDIIKDDNGDLGVVVYDDCAYRIEFEYANGYKQSLLLSGLSELEEWKNYAVVGNIWENPELLEGKDIDY